MSNTKPLDFIFNDLSREQDFAKQIDGLAAGTFISMWGDEVTFAEEELPDYIKNTIRVINSTKTASGEIVGLPIDQDGHDHAGGAGWIVGLELDEARKVIKFDVKWTEIGLELISKNIRRFFSPSVDVFNKVILGGSLTNYPASRDIKGRIMLQPIELSQTLQGVSMEKTLLETIAGLPAAIAEAMKPKPVDPPAEPPATEPAPVNLSNVPNASLASLGGDPGRIEELDNSVKAIVAQRVAAELRVQHTTKFVADLIGGTKEKPYGFAVKSKDLIAWMLSLSDAQAKFAERLLSEMRNKAIDFAERGWESGEGFTQNPQLPEIIKPILREFLGVKGNTVAMFFKANPELGKMEDFNLTEFNQVKE